MKRIVSVLMFLILLSGCERYVVEISDVTLSGMYVVDTVVVINNTIDTTNSLKDGQIFNNSNFPKPFNNIKTNDFNINFESSSFLGEFEMIWGNKNDTFNTPIRWLYDSRQSEHTWFKIVNNTSYRYGELFLKYKSLNSDTLRTIFFTIEKDGYEDLTLLSQPYNSTKIRLYLTRIGP